LVLQRSFFDSFGTKGSLTLPGFSPLAGIHLIGTVIGLAFQIYRMKYVLQSPGGDSPHWYHFRVALGEADPHGVVPSVPWRGFTSLVLLL
jgi:hypothetical protein